ncbi:MAG: nuclear transport factor 2 family protein [Bacteroidales bacterium]|nr:nuclear transport factor 2 family protein [Bacteroidales bacterium]
MKKYFVLICLLFSAGLVFPQTDKDLFKEDCAKINEVLDKYIIANETQNIRLIEEIWAIDEDIEAFGTAAGERIKGWEEIRKVFIHQFNTFTDTYISARNRSVHIDDSGAFAWVSQMLNYNYLLEGVQRKYEGVRHTVVLKKINGEWKMLQMHLSLPH